MPKKKGWAKSTIYRGIKYRSSWEPYISKLLLYSGITFQYEPKRFYLTPKVSYLPDFYIPDMGLFIEVKGWLKEYDLMRMKLFQQNYKLVYLGADELAFIHGFPAAKISDINLNTYIPNFEELRRFRIAIRKVNTL